MNTEEQAVYTDYFTEVLMRKPSTEYAMFKLFQAKGLWANKPLD